MVYVILILAGLLLVFLLLVWLRKVQFDAVHRNLLDLVDHYGGKVIRGGFAVRPRYSGTYKDLPLTVNISAERKTKNSPRQFYISVFLKAASAINFTVMSNVWLGERDHSKTGKIFTRQIFNKEYVVEVAEKKFLKMLNFEKLESFVKRLHPFAYTLVSRNGLIFERLSQNLIKDTEFEVLDRTLLALYDLTTTITGDLTKKSS
ncbi:MAG: hypothetical protein Kow0042_29080 [Calditrichia bacterium]